MAIRSRNLLLPLLVAASAAAFAPAPANAWGAQGHRLVAALAWEDMSAPARAEADRLLALEPGATLPGIAAWADELRGSDPDLGRRSARWHYVNIGEADCHYHAATACPDGDCVVGAIDEQARILADRSRPEAERLQALKFVVHFVGDVHQPLHAGYGHDKGGNTVQVNVDGQGSNLHRLWDSGLLNTRGLDDQEYQARLALLPLAVPDRPALPPASAQWAEQSCSIAVADGFYPDGARIDAGYVGYWLPRAEEQLRRGGIELARLLDATLAPQP